ncbi:MAG: sensor histidine kinase [Desulfobulbaceae bacterium]|nr:sensor histidine kinase [Desulfobulbaceae bacterium]
MKKKFDTKCGIAIPTTFFRSLVFFSLLAVLALPIYTFFFLTPAVEGFIIRAQEQQAVRLAVHMESKMIPDKSQQLGKHILTADVLKKIRGTSRDFNLFKVRILFPDGEVLFSTKEEEIGTVVSTKEFLQTVKGGKSYSQLTPKGEKSSEGTIMPGDIVETYAPILRDGKTIGVFEIYYDISATEEKMRGMLSLFYITLFPIVFILFIAVILSCRKAGMNITRRIEAEEKLLEQSAELQQRNDELTELIIVCRERQQRLETAQKARQEAQDRVQEELLKRQKMQADLLRHVVEAQEDERARIARELHDETAQTLTAASLNFATLKNQLDGKPELSDLVHNLQNLCKQMNQDLYRLVHDLRPAQLDDLGLVPALRYLTDEGLRNTGMKASLQVIGKPKRLEPFLETVIFRIVQEALTNITRHAETDFAAVRLEFVKGKGLVKLLIRDEGKGFDPAKLNEVRHGWGLAGIEERVKALNGSFRIESAPGKGTSLEAVVPVQQLAVCQIVGESEPVQSRETEDGAQDA